MQTFFVVYSACKGMTMDIQLFIFLLGGHYLADFGLQSRHMAEMKGRVFIETAGFHNLTAHAAIHGLLTGLITQSLAAALVVAVTHWIIDFGKASELLTDKFPHTKGARRHGQKHGLYGLDIDQCLHIVILLGVVVAIS
jgi:hypothetical protein